MLQLIKNILGISRYELTTTNQINQYGVGQVWQYKTRHHEPHSRLTIVRIDKDIKGDAIIHVSLNKLQISNPSHPDGEIHELPHSPLTVEALNSSLVQMEQIVEPLPDQSEGYNLWLQSWKTGKASIFAMPVRELIDMVEEALKNEDHPKTPGN